MQLLLDDRNVIIAIASNISYDAWGNIEDIKSWKINDNFYIMDNNYTTVTVDTVPSEVRINEWRYENNEFVYNEEYTSEDKERLTTLEAEASDLLDAVSELGDTTESTSDDVNTAITELGDLIADLIARVEELEAK